jgi:hypothetical protein
MHPRDRKWRNRFVFIECYMDESGIHGAARICTVAGYYGTQVAWNKFGKEWLKVLRDFGLEHHGFHSKEFWGRHDKKRVKPYDNWTDTDADKYLERLVAVIMRNRVFPFGHAVVVDHWNNLALYDRRVMTGGEIKSGKWTNKGCPNKCYYLPFLFAVIDSARYSGTVDKIHYFAGLDKTFSGYARDLYSRFSRDNTLPFRASLGAISFPQSKETPPLQAADLLAYRMYQHCITRLRHQGKRTKLLEHLIKSKREGQSFNLFDSKNLMKLRGDMRLPDAAC